MLEVVRRQLMRCLCPGIDILYMWLDAGGKRQWVLVGPSMGSIVAQVSQAITHQDPITDNDVTLVSPPIP